MYQLVLMSSSYGGEALGHCSPARGEMTGCVSMRDVVRGVVVSVCQMQVQMPHKSPTQMVDLRTLNSGGLTFLSRSWGSV